MRAELYPTDIGPPAGPSCVVNECNSPGLQEEMNAPIT